MIRSTNPSRRAQFGPAFPLLSRLQPVIDSSLVKHPADRRVSVDLDNPDSQRSGRDVSISVRAYSGTSQSKPFCGLIRTDEKSSQSAPRRRQCPSCGPRDHRPLSRRSRPDIVDSRARCHLSSAQDEDNEDNEDNGLSEGRSDLIWRSRRGRRLAG